MHVGNNIKNRLKRMLQITKMPISGGKSDSFIVNNSLPFQHFPKPSPHVPANHIMSLCNWPMPAYQTRTHAHARALDRCALPNARACVLSAIAMSHTTAHMEMSTPSARGQRLHNCDTLCGRARAQFAQTRKCRCRSLTYAGSARAFVRPRRICARAYGHYSLAPDVRQHISAENSNLVAAVFCSSAVGKSRIFYVCLCVCVLLCSSN